MFRIALSMARVAAPLVRCFTAAGDGPIETRHALIVPPGPVGSLGDEAMVLAAWRGLTDRGYASVSVAQYIAGEDQVPAETGVRHVDISTLVSSRGPRALGALRRLLSGHDDVYLIGADVLDGYYSRTRSWLRLALLDLVARCGKHVAILGFSFSGDAPPDCEYLFRTLPPGVRICARDPVSRRRLEGVADRPIETVADLAFLVEPTPGTDRVRAAVEWIASRRGDHARILGVNANYLHAELFESPEILTDAYVREFRALMEADPGLHLVLVPHDRRSQQSDHDLLEAVATGLSASLADRIYHFPPDAGPAEVKALCGELDLVLTGRMHLSIAALGAGTPIGCLTYQGKFEGLFEHAGISNVDLDPRQAIEPGRLSALVRDLFARREELVAQIDRARPRIRELALGNFEPPGPPRLTGTRRSESRRRGPPPRS